MYIFIYIVDKLLKVSISADSNQQMITRQPIYYYTVRTYMFFGNVQVVLCDIQPRPQIGAGVVVV